MQRRNRLDRIASHLDRVIGPLDEVIQRAEEIEALVERLAPPLPQPPLPLPLPGRDREAKRCVRAFYTVLKRRYGERVAEDIVREAAQEWKKIR